MYQSETKEKLKVTITKQENFFPDGSPCWNAQIWKKIDNKHDFVYAGNGRFCKSLEEAKNYKKEILKTFIKSKENNSYDFSC